MSLLKKGDKVAFVAPSSFVKKEKLKASEAFLRKLGLEVVYAENIEHEYRYMAGSDEERAAIINRMFADKSIKALICVRGGGGSSRILPYLNYKLIKSNKKPIIGLSDSTSLQNAVVQLGENICLTGYLGAYFPDENNLKSKTGKSLKSALFDDVHEVKSGKSLISGNAKGKLVGGNLSCLNYLCGTKYFPSLKDSILLLEDVGEKTFHIDQKLNQIKQQKGFDKLKGIIIGQFSDSIIVDKEDGSFADCIKDFIAELNIPVIYDFDYGHVKNREILPLGAEVSICSSGKKCLVKW